MQMHDPKSLRTSCTAVPGDKTRRRRSLKWRVEGAVLLTPRVNLAVTTPPSLRGLPAEQTQASH